MFPLKVSVTNGDNSSQTITMKNWLVHIAGGYVGALLRGNSAVLSLPVPRVEQATLQLLGCLLRQLANLQQSNVVHVVCMAAGRWCNCCRPAVVQ